MPLTQQGYLPAVIQGLLCSCSLRGIQGEQAAQQLIASLAQSAAIKVKPPHWKLALQVWSSGRELELHSERGLVTARMVDTGLITMSILCLIDTALSSLVIAFSFVLLHAGVHGIGLHLAVWGQQKFRELTAVAAQALTK